MKKQFINLIIWAVIFNVILPVAIFAQAPPSQVQPITATGRTDIGLNEILTLITNAANWFLAFVAIIAVIILVYAGFLFITAEAEEEKIQKAKDYLKYSLVGLVIAILAFSIVFLIQSFLNTV